jgi:hypothetical protein
MQVDAGVSDMVILYIVNLRAFKVISFSYDLRVCDDGKLVHIIFLDIIHRLVLV